MSLKNRTPEAVHELIDGIPVEGVDINPQRKEGESLYAFKRRMQRLAKSAKIGETVANAKENAERNNLAFAYFMDGVPEGKDEETGETLPAIKEPTVIEVGMRLKMRLPNLLTVAREKSWDLQRANKKASEKLAGGEMRLQLATRVDRAMLVTSEEFIVSAAEGYMELLRKTRLLPTDHTELTESDDPGEKTAEGALSLKDGATAIHEQERGPRNRTGPKRGRTTLIRQKTELLNDVVNGFMGLYTASRTLGLVLPIQSGGDVKIEESSTNDVAKKLQGLNLTLIQVQSGEKENEIKNVTNAK